MVASAHVGWFDRWRSASVLRVALVAALLFGSACGVSRTREPDRREELLSPLPPRSIGCQVERDPEQLPAVDAVVDSAMLAASVRELSHPEPLDPGYVLLTLTYDREGINVRRDIIEHNIRPLMADSVQRLVFAARRQVEETEREWGVRLRVDVAEPVMLRVGRREFCPPVPRSREVAEAMERTHLMAPRFRRGARERVVHMRALVGERGIITSAHVARGELRGSTVERELAEYLRQFLFTPATLDGVPTSGWVTIPVRIRA